MRFSLKPFFFFSSFSLKSPQALATTFPGQELGMPRGSCAIARHRDEEGGVSEMANGQRQHCAMQDPDKGSLPIGTQRPEAEKSMATTATVLEGRSVLR